MQRFLLFDSGCMVCSSLARKVEQESQGWLQARSLTDIDIQADLNRVKPKWRWEPMLMEKEDENIHIYTGITFRLKMLVSLGPQHTWNVIQLLGNQRNLIHSTNSTRRDILKGSIALLGGLAFGLGLGQLPKDSRAESNVAKIVGGLRSSLQLPSNHPDIAVLSKTYAAQTSTSSFGRLDWEHVYKLEFENSSMPGYVITFEKSIGTPLTFLVISNMASTREDAGLVGRLVKKNENSKLVDWFVLDGRSLADAATAARNTSGTSEPDFISMSCIIPCMDKCLRENLVGNCADYCTNCVVDIATGGGTFNADCVGCLFCAGVNAVGCARQCATNCSEIA